VHSLSVWFAVAVVVALMLRLRHRPAERAVLDGPLVAWICVAVGQAAIGYLQYFTDVPPALVAAHVAGATVLWAVTVGLTESMSIAVTPAEPNSAGQSSAGQSLDELGALVDDEREEATDLAHEISERIGTPRGVAPERDEQEQHQHGDAQLLHGFERHGTTSN
jgi:hypothetical protein